MVVAWRVSELIIQELYITQSLCVPSQYLPTLLHGAIGLVEQSGCNAVCAVGGIASSECVLLRGLGLEAVIHSSPAATGPR